MSEKQMNFGTPQLAEYTVAGEEWRVGQFDRLAAEFDIQTQDLPLFHAALAPDVRRWLIVRRLYGFQPLLPPADFNEDDFRIWHPRELAAALNLTQPQLKAELDVVRGTWNGVRSKAQVVPTESPQEVKERRKREFTGDLPFNAEAVLDKHGFAIKLKQAEKLWLAERVQEFDRLLTEKTTKQLARNMLMTELHLRRLDDSLASVDENMGENWRDNMKMRKDLQAGYNDQLKMLNQLAPWAAAITGKYAMVGVLSDVTKAIQQYKKNDTRLVDGLLTTMEIRVECRRSVQSPQPRYRAGLAVYVAEAKAGLWDPKWAPTLTPAELRRIDKAWAAAYVEASVEAGDPLPDLEQDGPDGEYASLAAAVQKKEGEQNGEKHGTAA